MVTSLTPPPATALPGFVFVVTAGVRNQGAVAAGVSITRFELVSTAPGAARKGLEGAQNISALPPGASSAPAVSVAIDEDTLPGEYFLRACANGKDPKIPESNTANNCFQTTAKIIIRNGPDLAVTAISDPTSSVPQGQTFLAPTTYTVTNTGGEAAGPSLVKFYLVLTAGTTTTRIDDLKTADPEAVGTLGPGATFTHTLTLAVRSDTPPGTYRLQGCADAGSPKTVIEKDENNNCKTSVGTVQVTPAPDLVVKRVTVAGAPLTVDQGDALAIQVVVRNTGLVPAAASTLKLILVSTGATALPDQKLGTVAVPGLPAKTSVILDATPTVQDEIIPGTYTVQGCADASPKVVLESLESNNCDTALGTVTVTGLPLSPADLAVTALTRPPATRLPGETFSLTATVVNNGTGASPSTTSKFYLVNALVNATIRKNLKGVQIVGPLAVGATNATAVTVEVFEDTIPGAYFLQACADGDKQLHELEEDDNCFTSSVS